MLRVEYSRLLLSLLTFSNTMGFKPWKVTKEHTKERICKVLLDDIAELDDYTCVMIENMNESEVKYCVGEQL